MERWVTSGHARLWTFENGAGVPVVMCSGGPGCCDYLEPVANLVDDLARTIRFDSRGCGRSTAGPPYTFTQSIEDLEAIRIQYGLQRWFVLGHSAGADLALAYALEHRSRVLGIICIAGGRIHNDRDWHDAYVRGRDAGLEPPLELAYPYNQDVNQQLNAEWKAFIKRPSLLNDLAHLDCPALFVYGSEDIRPHWPIEQVARLVPGAQFTLVEGAGHNIWLTHSHELAGVVRPFLAGAQSD